MTPTLAPAGPLIVERADAVVRLTFHRPQTRNALTEELCGALRGALSAAAADKSCRLVIVTGSGGAFASGADIREMHDMAREPARMRRYYALLRETQESLYALPMPTLAVIDGYCIGAGLSLALACDLRVATQASSFAAPPARLGLLYSSSELSRLVGRIGPSRARDLLFTGRRVASAEAFTLGLVERLVAGDELERTVAALGAELAAASPFSLLHLKQHLIELERADRGASLQHDARSADAFFGPDAAAGMLAFLERRTPQFPDR